VFTPVLLKHSKSFSLVDSISVGVDRMQRNFEPMRKQVEAGQKSELTDVAAKVVIYEAFVEGKLEAPKHLARSVHGLYFEPKYEEFRPRTIWSLSKAFTSAFKGTGVPFPNLRLRPRWVNSWKPGFHNRLTCGRSVGHPFPANNPCLNGLRGRGFLSLQRRTRSETALNRREQTLHCSLYATDFIDAVVSITTSFWYGQRRARLSW